MGRNRRYLSALLLLAASALLQGQKVPEDNVFRLVQAERAEQYEHYGMHYRLVQGHARFLHNDTYLLCDSASWNVDSRFIEAYGNVQVIQNNTFLKSEKMFYWIDDSRAQFSGTLVELIDKDGNTLRTDQLTYNTKDSVAVFNMGGALKDKDGNVIESRKGTYDGKEGLFTFEERVEIYMDSIEMKTQTLRYLSDEERAHFGRNTQVWRDNGFLRADGGWYDRKQQLVHFADHVVMFDPSYDAWADEVYYRQADGAVDLYNNAQVLDTANKCAYLGDHLQYIPATDSLSERGLLTEDPAIIYFGENENHQIDTLYARADTFYVYAVPRCDIPDAEVKEAEKRRSDIHYDALGKKRTEEAAAREAERIKKLREVGKLPPEWVEKAKQATADSLAALSCLDSLVRIGAIDSTLAAVDSVRASREIVDSLIRVVTMPPVDSTAALQDSTAAALVPRDTTPVRYIHAWHNVKMFRNDLQAKCDSVVFTELDSIARLFGSPVLWNEVRNQLSSDEMSLLMLDGALERGSMVTNAWLISQQDSIHFDQIKCTEMQGWFRDNKLYRFDALGGVSAIFYMADEQVLTTINVKESKSLTAAIKDGSASRLFYVESIQSDVYPIGELVEEKQRLKDFNWRGDERPENREVVTSRTLRSSERSKYANARPPIYKETNKFFDNYMIDLFTRREEEKRQARERKQAQQDSLAAVAAEIPDQVGDNVAPMPDTTVVLPEKTTVTPDTTAVIPGPTGHLDSLATPVVTFEAIDSVQVVPTGREVIRSRDTVALAAVPASPETVVQSKELSRAEKRALRKAERQARREARKAARAARRAERQAARAARKAGHDS